MLGVRDRYECLLVGCSTPYTRGFNRWRIRLQKRMFHVTPLEHTSKQLSKLQLCVMFERPMQLCLDTLTIPCSLRSLAVLVWTIADPRPIRRLHPDSTTLRSFEAARQLRERHSEVPSVS